jgi:hypothetical protein
LAIGLLMTGLFGLGGCARGSVQDALGLGKRAPDEFAVVKRAPLIVPPEFDLRPPDPGAPRPNIGRTSDQARVALTGTPSGPSQAAQVLTGASANGQTIPGSSPASGLSNSVPASTIADDLLSAGTNLPSQRASGATSQTAATQTAAAQTSATQTAGADGAAGSHWTRGELAMVALAGGNQSSPEIRRTIAEENPALADVEASLFTRIVAWRDPSTMGATIDAPAEAQRLRDNKVASKAPTEGDTPTVVNRRQSALQGLLGDIF